MSANGGQQTAQARGPDANNEYSSTRSCCVPLFVAIAAVLACMGAWNCCHVIPEGKTVAYWDLFGNIEVFTGPQMVFSLGHIEPLKMFTASPSQYLVVQHFDGNVDHIPGPSSLYKHPTRHAYIGVESGIELLTNEAIVVYRQSREDGNTAERFLIRGPRLYIPSTNEWLHNFSWHGTDPRSKAHSGIKIPRALQFTKLRTIPDRMHVTVQHVRTSDDALVTAQMMVFFELLDVEKMLSNSHDPVGDFINSASADVVSFTSNLTFQEFKDASAVLNDLAVYQNLVAVADRIGYKITKVVFRGYTSSDALQLMTDRSIETRTRQLLESESELQQMDLEDTRLRRTRERAEAEQELAELQANGQRVLETIAAEAALAVEKRQLEFNVESARRKKDEELRAIKEKHTQEEKHFAALRTLGVDMNHYFATLQPIHTYTKIDTLPSHPVPDWVGEYAAKSQKQ